MVAQVREQLRTRLDNVDVLAVALLGLIARGVVVGVFGFGALAEQLGVLALEEVELARDEVREPAPPEHRPRLAPAVALLIRTWNLFHGNAKPPERRAYLEQMVRLVSADQPDLVCLQELPAWSLPYLRGWSGMAAIGDVAQRPRLGPVPIAAQLGRAVTSLNHGLFRSAVSGQANAVLLARGAELLEHEVLTLNARSFREAQAAWLRLGLIARLAWAKERRLVQVVRARAASGRIIVIANLHTTSYPADERLADAELLRAAVFADAIARPGETLVLAGDFNVPAARSATLAQLAGPEWGFSPPVAEGIDQVLVRGASVEKLERWPRDRRRLNGCVLSDHTPVEARIA